MYKIRQLKDSDYTELCKWWEDWRWEAPAKNLLPNNGTCGVMVSYNNMQVCAGFLYFTNSDFALVEYVVSNFKVKDKVIRKEALNRLLKELTHIAKSKGVKVIFSSIKNPSLIKAYERNGYKQGTIGTTEMFNII